MTKPLFIPLKSEYFEAFAAGSKSIEYGKLGPRWNEKTCVQGRPVVLSCGYGKQRRLRGTITAFEIKNWLEVEAVRSIYLFPCMIACIHSRPCKFPPSRVWSGACSIHSALKSPRN